MKCPKDATTANQKHSTPWCNKKTKCGWYCLRPSNHKGDCHAHQGSNDRCLAIFNENECKGHEKYTYLLKDCTKTRNKCYWKNILALIKLLED